MLKKTVIARLFIGLVIGFGAASPALANVLVGHANLYNGGGSLQAYDGCYWSGWQWQGMAKVNTLYCNGSSAGNAVWYGSYNGSQSCMIQAKPGYHAEGQVGPAFYCNASIYRQ